jgi:diacylglycerol kinase (ATP)
LSSSSTILITNPLAGRHRLRKAADTIELCKKLEAYNLHIEVINTLGPRDATRVVQQAARDGIETVIVSGGDGTINEALQGIVGSHMRLAIWPTGTANVLARELKIPFNIDQLAQAIALGKTQSIYIGCATKEESEERRYFFLMAGIGLDASIVYGVRAGLKKRVGEMAFWYSGFEHLIRWQPQIFNIEVNGESFEATFAAIGKAPHYGGNLSITPHAKLESPEFEVCIVSSRNKLGYLRLLRHAIKGGLYPKAINGIRLIKTNRVSASGKSMVQVDGELIGQLPFSFEIVSSPIEVIVP